jgi:molybdopterin synthase sulfur carrier subunit
MSTAFIPPLLRELTGGVDQVQVEGTTVRGVIRELEAKFPGIAERLLAGDVLKPGLAVAINGAVASQGVLQKVPAGSEVHFLPAIGGG